ncbi:MAG: histidine--tRNA ligase [bacterium]|nr:histidine--tRNA ligase [bacterium]
MSDTLAKVNSELPGGFRDYLPQEMIVRNRMIANIRAVFESFGFDPLETPGMEYRRTLTGGNPDFRMITYDARKSTARLSSDVDDPERTALRFDLTVPLARVVARYMGMEGADRIRLPFKRYQIGNVWRGEKPQAGRFCEFMQFDADVVGTATPVADAEIIALMVVTMRTLGVEHFRVRFNNRKLLNALSAYAGFDPALAPEVMRIIDKLPKIGRAAVLREFVKPTRESAPQVTREEAIATASGGHTDVEGAENEEAAFGLGLPSDVADRIGAFLDLTGTTDELLNRCDDLFNGIAVAEDGIRELREIVAALRAMGIDERSWAFDLSIARGLAYYTGPVFETFITNPDGSSIEGFGGVFSGGRYDDLVSRFTDANVPATGASIGVDRIFDQLTRLGKITRVQTLTQVLVTVMDQSAMPEYLAMVSELRAAGIRTMLWVGEESAFKAQLAYATAQEIPIVIIAGDRERAAGTVTVKDMRARRQAPFARPSLVDTVRHALGASTV